MDLAETSCGGVKWVELLVKERIQREPFLIPMWTFVFHNNSGFPDQLDNNMPPWTRWRREESLWLSGIEFRSSKP